MFGLGTWELVIVSRHCSAVVWKHTVAFAGKRLRRKRAQFQKSGHGRLRRN